MSIKLAAATALAMAAALATRAASGATLNIYAGPEPATGDTALDPSNTLLATCAASSPMFADPADSDAGVVLTAAAIAPDAQADNDGTATFFRVLASDGSDIYQGSVSDTGGGGDMVLTPVALVKDGPVNITSLTVTVPKA